METVESGLDFTKIDNHAVFFFSSHKFQLLFFFLNTVAHQPLNFGVLLSMNAHPYSLCSQGRQRCRPS